MKITIKPITGLIVMHWWFYALAARDAVEHTPMDFASSYVLLGVCTLLSVVLSFVFGKIQSTKNDWGHKSPFSKIGHTLLWYSASMISITAIGLMFSTMIDQHYFDLSSLANPIFLAIPSIAAYAVLVLIFGIIYSIRESTKSNQAL